tara:strand:+ start:843 stop:1430 length:588 start_codon:yes stop_codon:yes gene_type:complete
MKYLIIDTETTGLDHESHELLSLGAIVLIDGVVVESIEVKIRPSNIDSADPRALEVNGYSAYRWRHAIDGLSACTVIKHLFLCHQDSILVGHNVQFDIKFLKAFANRFQETFLFPTPYLDTRDICRASLTAYGCESMSLDNICKFLGWKRRKAHTALSDCEDCAKIINSLCPPSPKFILRLKMRKYIHQIKGLLQ